MSAMGLYEICKTCKCSDCAKSCNGCNDCSGETPTGNDREDSNNCRFHLAECDDWEKLVMSERTKQMLLEENISDLQKFMKEDGGTINYYQSKHILELLEELKFRREHADLLEDHECVGGYVCDDGRVIKAGQRYRHFKKGNIYIVVIPCVYDTEDMKEYVIYRGGDNKRRMWARPVEEFMSEVDRNKYPQATQQYRFELLEDGDENVNV